jgi:hypothetical protein
LLFLFFITLSNQIMAVAVVLYHNRIWFLRETEVPELH